MYRIKTVKQCYSATPEISRLLEQFRCMVNDCVGIGLAANVTSMKALSLKAYHVLAKYPTYSGYKLTAIAKAAGLLKNYRKTLKKKQTVHEPYAKKLGLVAYYGIKVQDGKLRLPIRAGEGIFIPLNPHVLRTLGSFRVRSITLTDSNLGIAYERYAPRLNHIGYMGIDRNLDNVTTATTDLAITQYDLSEATDIKSKYREVKRHMNRNDHRIRQQVYSKYGTKQRNKIRQILHHASKMIVTEAKHNRHCIVMEKLTGIRKLYMKGNGQGREYRGRMNSWSYYELQRQIHYKADWEGVPVMYVNPWGTSAKCSKCGSRMSRKPEENRKLTCTRCGFNVDRDVNAALNLAASGALRFGAVASASEAMVAEPVEVIRKVDADELVGGP